MRYPLPDDLRADDIDLASGEGVLAYLASCGAHRMPVPEDVKIAARALGKAVATLDTVGPARRGDHRSTVQFVAWLHDIERHDLARRACCEDADLADLAHTFDARVTTACVVLGESRPRQEGAHGAPARAWLAAVMLWLSGAPERAVAEPDVGPQVEQVVATLADAEWDHESVLGVHVVRMHRAPHVVAFNADEVQSGGEFGRESGGLLLVSLDRTAELVLKQADGRDVHVTVFPGGVVQVALSPCAEVSAASMARAQAAGDGVGDVRPWSFLPSAEPEALVDSWFLGELGADDDVRLRNAVASDSIFRARYAAALQRRIARFEVALYNPAWTRTERDEGPLRSVPMPHLAPSAALSLFRDGRGVRARLDGAAGQTVYDEPWAAGEHTWRDAVVGPLTARLALTDDPLVDLREGVWTLRGLAEADPGGANTNHVVDAVLVELGGASMRAHLAECAARSAEAAVEVGWTASAPPPPGLAAHEMTEWATVALALRVALQRVADARPMDLDLLNRLGALDDSLEAIGPALAWVSDRGWIDLFGDVPLDYDAWWGWGALERRERLQAEALSPQDDASGDV